MIGSFKKFVNSDQDVVVNSLLGLVKSHFNISLIEEHKIVVRSDIEIVRHRHVTLISGGGSGHEPSHASWVSKGMLTAAVCGNVFSSPSVDAIFEAIMMCTTEESPGCLLIVKNYTGDALNFGLARELALHQNRKVEMVLIGDDVSLFDQKSSVGRRGIAGTVLVHKICGAMAEQGLPLSEILDMAKRISSNLYTIGVGLSPCIIPGNKEPGFKLGEDEYELGLGIHGEAGVLVSKMEDCNKIVDKCMQYIEKARTLDQEKEVIVMLNNLGSTTNLEMGILANHVLDCLVTKKIKPIRFYCGTFMTALEMVGFSLTILFEGMEIVPLLDQHTDSTSWIHSKGVNLEKSIMKIPEKNLEPIKRTETPESMFLEQVIKKLCQVAIKNESLLCDLDTKCGDGDFGNNFAKAGQNILHKLHELPLQDVSNTLYQCSMLVQKIGGTSGCVFGIFLLKMSESTKNKEKVGRHDWIQAFKNGIDGISKLTGAKLGDRTFLDTLIPVVEAMERHTKEDDSNFARIILEAAQKGSDATKDLMPKKGRASYLGKRVLGHVDPGAHAIYLLIQSWAEIIISQ